MFLRRICGRMLMAATKSEHPGATAAAAASTSVRNPLEEFFEADRSADDDKRVVYGGFSIYLSPLLLTEICRK